MYIYKILICDLIFYIKYVDIGYHFFVNSLIITRLEKVFSLYFTIFMCTEIKRYPKFIL